MSPDKRPSVTRKERTEVLKLQKSLEIEALDLLNAVGPTSLSTLTAKGFSPISGSVPDDAKKLFEAIGNPVTSVSSIDFIVEIQSPNTPPNLKYASVFFDNNAKQSYELRDDIDASDIFFMQTIDSAGMPLVLPSPRTTHKNLGYDEVIAILKNSGLDLTMIGTSGLEGILQFTKHSKIKTEVTFPSGPGLPQLYLREVLTKGISDTAAHEPSLDFTSTEAWHKTVVIGLDVGPGSFGELMPDSSLQMTLVSNNPNKLPTFHNVTGVPVEFKQPKRFLKDKGVAGVRFEKEEDRTELKPSVELIQNFRLAVLNARLGYEEPITRVENNT